VPGLGVVGFRDLDSDAFVERDDEVQEVHGIDIDLIPQRRVGAERVRIELGRHASQFRDNDAAHLVFRHSCSGS
jgi:hypothetical protein